MGHASIEAPPLKLGALVTHPKFGEGMVTDYEGSGAHARVQVEFADAGSKWLPSHARLLAAGKGSRAWLDSTKALHVLRPAAAPCRG
ncbi:hypothetical protein G6F63_015910 [Rhizopus arrhizus]|nr:hypothetical protein G6F63_015910 [Rhizopus arrhizus]